MSGLRTLPVAAAVQVCALLVGCVGFARWPPPVGAVSCVVLAPLLVACGNAGGGLWRHASGSGRPPGDRPGYAADVGQVSP